MQANTTAGAPPSMFYAPVSTIMAMNRPALPCFMATAQQPVSGTQQLAHTESLLRRRRPHGPFLKSEAGGLSGVAKTVGHMCTFAPTAAPMLVFHCFTTTATGESLLLQGQCSFVPDLCNNVGPHTSKV